MSCNNKVTVTTEPVCLSNSSTAEIKKIACEKGTGVIFISQVKYTNDIRGECETTANNKKQASATNSECAAYTTEKSAAVCNGRSECGVKLMSIWFEYGRSGSNCAFWARRLSVTYECIPREYLDF